MKKLSKIVLGSILSVAMVVTGGLAALNYQPYSVNAANDDAYATANDFIKGMTTYDTEDKTTNTGSPSIKYVVNEKQAGSGTEFTGIKLTGGNNDVFKFGNINLTKLGSYWGGSDHYDVDQDSPVNYESESNINYKSLLSFVYAPNNAISEAGSIVNDGTGSISYTPEMKALYIRMKNTVDSSEYIIIKIGGREDDTSKFGAVGIWAGSQADGGNWNSPTLYGERKRSDGISLNETASKTISNRGWATESTDIIYDANKNAVYSSATFGGTGLQGSYCVRNFANEKSVYSTTQGGVNSQDKQNPWSGFTKNADGEVVVEMDIRFDVNATCSGSSYNGYENHQNVTISTTSIILTSFGGYDFTKGTVETKNGADCKITSDLITENEANYVMPNNGKNVLPVEGAVLYAPSYYYQPLIGNKSIIGSTAKIYKKGQTIMLGNPTFSAPSLEHAFGEAGDYVIEYYLNDVKIGSEDLSVAKPVSNDTLGVLTGKGASATFDEYSYTSNASKTWKTKGVKLTGGKDATFDLGLIDISKGSWSGSETAITGDYNSFIDFWYLPSVGNLGKTNAELRQFTIKLTDSANADNYMNITVNVANNGAGYDVMYFKAQASNQTKSGAYRNTKGFISAEGSYVTKNGILQATNGATKRGTSLEEVFPTGVQSQGISLVYSKQNNTLYSPVTFKETLLGLEKSFAIRNFNETYTDGVTSGDTAWSGFTSDFVNVSITFNDVSGADESSIIVTKLGDYVLSQGIKTIDENLYVEELGKNIPTYTRTNSDTEIPAPVLRQTVDMKGIKNSYVKILSGETLVDTVTFDKAGVNNTDSETYKFTADGTYTLQFYNAENKLIGSTEIVSRSGYGAVVDATNATVKLNGGELTVASTISAGDTITFTPATQSLTGTVLNDVRSFKLNGSDVDVSSENVLPIIYNSETGVWTYTVDERDIVDDVVKIEVVFDKLCQVTFIDEYVTENVVKTAWATDGTVDFPKLSSDNGNIRNGNATDGKLFIGYNRCDDNVDAYMKGADNKTIANTIYRNPVTGQNTIGKDMSDNNTDFDLYEMLVPDMKFKAVYLDYELNYYLTVDANDNAVWHVEIAFDKEDVDVIKSAIKGDNRLRFFYTKSETVVSGAYFGKGTEKAVNSTDLTEVNGKYVVELPTVTLADGEYEVVGIYWLFSFAQGGTSVRLFNEAKNVNLNVVANEIINKCNYLKEIRFVSNGEYGEYIYKVVHAEGEGDAVVITEYYSRYGCRTLNMLYSLAGYGENYFA